MAVSQQVLQLLKNLKTPNGNDRLARAMFLANAAAYSVRLDPSQTWQQLHEAQEKAFAKVLSEVNEGVAVDTKLAKALFQQALRIRHELLLVPSDPAVIHMALTSHTAALHQNTEQKGMSDWLNSHHDFGVAQFQAIELLAEHLDAQV